MKKLAVLMVSAMLLLCVCAIGMAETSGDFEYTVLDDGTIQITRYQGSDTTLSIPEVLDGRSVTSIGDNAFIFCTNLTSITIPDSVISIGHNPFLVCSNLISLHVSADQPYLATIDGVLFSKEDKRLISYPIAKTNEEYEIPQGIKIIGQRAFYGCDALTSITIPDSVTSIGDSAFSMCGNLTSMTVPGSVTTIGNYIFAGCESLTCLTIPNMATEQQDFSSLVNLTSITILDGVTSIGDWAFCDCKSLTSITIPDSVTSIGDSAFSWCESLTSITIPDSVAYIGANPFFHCSNLNNIIISSDHPHFFIIDGVLFSKADKRLISYPYSKTDSAYAVPQGIKIIDAQAFSYFESLTSITISNSVTTIGDWAFSCCNSLTSVTIPDSVTSIGKDAFKNCPRLTTIIVARDSYAAQYCKENNLPYAYPDSNDWLND